jgi:hypothetical protein
LADVSMVIAWLLLLLACDGGSKDDSGVGGDDAGDDSSGGTGDDSGSGDDSGTECTELAWYEDVDLDGYGAGDPTMACSAPGDNWIETAGDCDDAVADIHPAATEICNGLDDDCDEAIDDKDPDVVGFSWYPDADGDGYPDTSGTPVHSCTSPGAYALEDAKHPADCDDADETRYPGAVEYCDDVLQGCIDGWKRDVGVATWYPASGGAPEDWTDALASGKYGKAATISILDEGELVICDGTWYAQLIVGDGATHIGPANTTITGLHGSGVTTLSGGDDSAILRVAAHDASVTAQGLTMTEGNANYGAAVSTGALLAGGTDVAWSDAVAVTLRDVRIVDNVPLAPSASAITYVVNGSLTLEDTTIANNALPGVYAEGSSVLCSGSPKNDAGIWGNSSMGLILGSYGKFGLAFESDGCDFDGTGGAYTPSYDALLSGELERNTFDFGDDAVFLCDISAATCK